MGLGKKLKKIVKKTVNPTDLIKKVIDKPGEIFNPINTLDPANLSGVSKTSQQLPGVTSDLASRLGRIPTKAEQEYYDATLAGNGNTERAATEIARQINESYQQNNQTITNLFESTFGRKPTQQEVDKLQEQFSTGHESIKRDELGSFFGNQYAREEDARRAAAEEKAQAEFKKEQADYQQKILDQEAAAETSRQQEAKLTQLASSIGGVSPSELEQLRAAIQPPAGTVGTNPPPEQVIQNILAARTGAVNQQAAGFSSLRDSLSKKFADARLAEKNALETGLTEFGTQAQNVQKSVLERLLPQIQSQLAARGLETGGGAFQAQTAKLATDLATDTEAEIANQRLAGRTNLGATESSDIRALADLEAQHAEIQRQQAEADKLQREGRLDQAVIDRLNQNVAAFNRQYELVSGQQQQNQAYGQQNQLLTKEQSFQNLQAAFNRRQQDLARDLQSRQFEQAMAFRNRELTRQAPAKGNGAFPTISGALSGAVQGGAAFGPWGAVAGAAIGGAKGYSDYRTQSAGLRNQFSSPTTSYLYR